MTDDERHREPGAFRTWGDLAKLTALALALWLIAAGALWMLWRAVVGK